MIDDICKTYKKRKKSSFHLRISFGFEDIDECEEEISNCHTNAECINAIGNYSCQCVQGYFGDGFSCVGEFVVSMIRFFLPSACVHSHVCFCRQRVYIHTCFILPSTCVHLLVSFRRQRVYIHTFFLFCRQRVYIYSFFSAVNVCTFVPLQLQT